MSESPDNIAVNAEKMASLVSPPEGDLQIEEAVRASTPRRRPIKLAKKKPVRRGPAPLTIEQILAWADAHHAATGKWPLMTSGPITGTASENWNKINLALHQGYRGLSGSTTLARLLAQYRGVRNRKGVPPLSEDQILQWADAYRERLGVWPTENSGPINETQWYTWHHVELALNSGCHGLQGGNSLVKLLAQKRGAPYRLDRVLSIPQILVWADDWHRRYGTWPQQNSGPVFEGAQDTWTAVENAFKQGGRGLPGGSSLYQTLVAHRGIIDRNARPLHTREQILEWADRHKERTSRWPTATSGPIVDAPGETWKAVSAALINGMRGLPGGESLAELFVKERGHRNARTAPKLAEEQILEWADAYRDLNGQWPRVTSGPIPGEPGVNWASLNNALQQGLRGLPGGNSLARLLTEKRGMRNSMALPPLTEAQILIWAAAYRDRTGAWPTQKSGQITEAPGETWSAVATALQGGNRGLPGGSSLPRLIRANTETDPEVI